MVKGGKIVFIRPLPSIEDYRLFIPLSIGILTSAWRKKFNHQVLYLDRSFLSKDSLIQTAIEYDPDVYAVTSIRDSFQDAIEIIFALKALRPNARIVLGGSHVTLTGDCIKRILPQGVEVFIGDGSTTDIITGKTVQWDKNYWMPDWEDLPLNQYLPLISIQTSMGCKYHCLFCGEARIHGEWREMLTPDDVVKYISYISERFNITTFRFVDSTFTCPISRFERIISKFDALNKPIKWGAYTRVENLSIHHLKKMAHCGCKAIFMGIETLNEQIYKKIGKKNEISHLKEIITAAREYGIHVHINLIFGLPGDTEQTIRNTQDRIIELAPHSVFANPFNLAPGSIYSNNPEKYGITVCDKDWRLKVHLLNEYNYFSVKGLPQSTVLKLIEEFEQRINHSKMILWDMKDYRILSQLMTE